MGKYTYEQVGPAVPCYTLIVKKESMDSEDYEKIDLREVDEGRCAVWRRVKDCLHDKVRVSLVKSR